MIKAIGKKIVIASSAFILSAVVGLSVIKPYSTEAMNSYEQMIHINYASQEEVDQRRQERDAALAQAQSASAQVNALTSESAELSGELAELNALNDEQMELYQVISAQYAAALVAKADALNRYVQAQDNLEATQLRFSERLSVMFEYQNRSMLEVLLQSDSIAGFFINLEMISLIADADNQAIDQMQIALDDAQLQADTALAEAEELEATVAEKEAELDAIANGIALTEEQLASVNEALATWQAAESSAYNLAYQLDNEINRLQAEIDAANRPAPTAAPTSAPSNPSSPDEPSTPSEPSAPTNTPTPVPQPSTPSGNGTFVFPLYTWSYISSEYGYRYHPITGQYKYHAGMDIASGYGNTIIAAASGTVCYVEYPVPGQNTGGSGYGNYCIIDHGNGVYSLYGHCRDLYVSNGQHVSQGEAIGTVGSTGGSTGSHLHFECRTGSMWGATTDPRNYL